MAERIDDTGFGGIQLRQETTHFCYGIDAVLLADFAAGRQHGSYLDLGTNNGIIPLLLSVMTGAERLCGLEFQKAAAGLAERNVRDNGLENRIRIVCSDVLDIEEHFPKSSFEAVVCNPPYFRRGAGIVNAAEPLQAARHETSAGLEDFVRSAAYVLEDRGTLYMIHRPDRLTDVIWCCRRESLEPKRLRFVSPRRDRAPNLFLLECVKNAGRELKFLDPLAVYREDGAYTDEILRIYGRER